MTPAIGHYLHALSHSDPTVRRSAVAALAGMGEPALPFLGPVLRHESRAVRAGAAEALARMGGAGVEALVQAVSDKSKTVRDCALEALRTLGDERAAAHLVEAMNGHTDTPPFLLVDALVVLGAPAVPALVAELRDPDAARRHQAAETLHALVVPCTAPAARDSEQTLALRDALADPDQTVRFAAAGALWLVGDAQAVPALIECLRDPEAAVRSRAAWALGSIGDPSALAPLIDALGSLDWMVRQEAARALGALGHVAATPALIAAYRDEYALVRRAAVRALREAGDARAIPVLLEGLDSDLGFVREDAAEALTAFARRDPTPALRAAMPRLRALRRRGKIFRDALAQVEAATEPFKDLPISATAPPPDPADLPLPADTRRSA